MELINFFRTRVVKQKILSRVLKQGEIFFYFYFVIVYDALGFTQQWFYISHKKPDNYDIISVWQNLAVTMIGLILMYLANGGNKGKNFLEKYFAFSFTVGIKYAIIFLILSVLPGVSSLQNLIATCILNILMVVNIGIRIYQTRERFVCQDSVEHT